MDSPPGELGLVLQTQKAALDVAQKVATFPENALTAAEAIAAMAQDATEAALLAALDVP